MAILEDRRELEVDHAEAAVGGPVGDVAQLGVLVADAVGLKLCVELLLALGINLVDPRAAVGGDDLQLVGEYLDKARHERAAPLLQVAQHAYLLIKALLGHVAPEGLVHPPVEADSNQRTGRVFHFMHLEGWATVPGAPASGKRCLEPKQADSGRNRALKL